MSKEKQLLEEIKEFTKDKSLSTFQKEIMEEFMFNKTLNAISSVADRRITSKDERTAETFAEDFAEDFVKDIQEELIIQATKEYFLK